MFVKDDYENLKKLKLQYTYFSHLELKMDWREFSNQMIYWLIKAFQLLTNTINLRITQDFED